MKAFSIIFLLFSYSCHAQKMMKAVSDAKKIVINEKIFIGHPLKVLLKEINPQIKSALGNPENINNNISNHISFYFTEKVEYNKRKTKGENPTIIHVMLKRPEGKGYPKLSSSGFWSKAKTKIYGDMIILSISIIGEN